MAKNNQSNANAKGTVMAFFKKNIYIILMIACIIAIGTMITVAAVINANKNKPTGPVVDNPPVETPVDGNKPNPDKPVDKPSEPDKPVVKPEEPAPFKFVAMSPIAGAYTVSSEFDNSKFVHISSLGGYGTHEATDFVASVGTAVNNIFEGKVVSIDSQDMLYCTVVTIEHEGGFVSVYKLIDNVQLKVGDVVKQGQKIGEISTNGLFEKEKGAHLHLELLKDGDLVDVQKYMNDGPK